MDRRGARVAVQLQPAHDAVHGQHMAGHRRQRLAADEVPGGHALDDGIDGGEQHRRAVMTFEPGKPRQRRHALRDDGWMRRGAIVRLAIPRREFERSNIGRKKAERAGQFRHARPVAANDEEARRWRVGLRRDGASEIGEHEPFRTVGNVCERQRPAGREQARRRLYFSGTRNVHSTCLKSCTLSRKSRSRRNIATSWLAGAGRPPVSQA